ncbi:hypothetical protein MKQ70_29620 [Chitinophaga sedimenti]|uniref:two-component regulator propeller domain-containing protein n=1 Tax=Chitinophaga sedimenti TaxID=2033606 RepID=UPI002005DB91|nr:two-component regulator propeller domain-containing protein [Chitinophaga sedimenti]MCK7558915.1 hypothetical protein [Chitinophaga sedimenti]
MDRSPRGNGLIVYNHGANIDLPADDKWFIYQSGAGRGNLPTDDVRCVAKDKSGYIWIGTAMGVAVVQCAQQATAAQGCEAYIPILQQGNFAGYLFRNEQVNTIAVDGADRKWVGTQNGVWLISPAGDKIIEHFNMENSPLLSNEVRKIVVHPRTGEVFLLPAQACSVTGVRPPKAAPRIINRKYWYFRTRYHRATAAPSRLGDW